MRRIIDGAFGFAVRKATASMPRILMYHRFGLRGASRRLDTLRFEYQLQYIRRHFRPVHLLEIVDALKRGAPLPQRAVVITVDDGYEDFITLAVPLLRKYEVPATFFVVSDFVDQRLWLWYDALHHVCSKARRGAHAVSVGSLDATMQFDLEGPLSREHAWERMADALLPLPAQEKWTGVLEVADQMHVELPPTPSADYRASTWEQLRSLDPALFEIGGHTKTHAIVSLCNEDELKVELEESKRRIESELKTTVRSFCYPNGQPGDYDEPSVRAVKEAGYECAVVAHPGQVTSRCDYFKLPRVGAADQDSRFRLDLNGWSLLRGRVA